MDLAAVLGRKHLQVSYFCVDVSADDIAEVLNQSSSLFSFIDDRHMLSALENENKVTRKPFVLLIDSISEKYNPVIWESYIEFYHDRLREEYCGRYGHSLSESYGPELDHQDLTPALGNVIIRTEYVVWDEHDMALVVDILPSRRDGVGLPRWKPPCTVACPHITLGSLRESTNEGVINDLPRRWRESDASKGRIWSLGLSGRFELDGVIRAVLQPLPSSPSTTQSMVSSSMAGIQDHGSTDSDGHSDHTSTDVSRFRRFLQQICPCMSLQDNDSVLKLQTNTSEEAWFHNTIAPATINGSASV